MQPITLRRTGSAAIKLGGGTEKIADVTTEQIGGREALRWYECQLYRVGDRYAWHIGFRTRWQGEIDHDWADFADTAADLIGSIGTAEPIVGPKIPERVGFPPGPAYAERQAALLADLRRHYEQCISAALEAGGVTLDEAEYDASAARDPGAETGENVFDFQHVLRWAQHEIAALRLSRAEATAICDANNGGLLLEFAETSIAANVFDAARLDGLDEKWDIDAAAIYQRIEAAGRGAKFALAWACAQFWRRTALPTDRALRESGFIFGEAVR